MLTCVYVSLCTTVVHNTAQNSSDNFPSYPPDNHHCSDDVYWRGTEGCRRLPPQTAPHCTVSLWTSMTKVAWNLRLQQHFTCSKITLQHEQQDTIKRHCTWQNHGPVDFLVFLLYQLRAGWEIWLVLCCWRAIYGLTPFVQGRTMSAMDKQLSIRHQLINQIRCSPTCNNYLHITWSHSYLLHCLNITQLNNAEYLKLSWITQKDTRYPNRWIKFQKFTHLSITDYKIQRVCQIFRLSKVCNKTVIINALSTYLTSTAPNVINTQSASC